MWCSPRSNVRWMTGTCLRISPSWGVVTFLYSVLSALTLNPGLAAYLWYGQTLNPQSLFLMGLNDGWLSACQSFTTLLFPDGIGVKRLRKVQRNSEVPRAYSRLEIQILTWEHSWFRVLLCQPNNPCRRCPPWELWVHTEPSNLSVTFQSMF